MADTAAGRIPGICPPLEPIDVTSVRATIVIPQETEKPERADRVELRVLDDLAPTVERWTLELIAAGVGNEIDVEGVRGVVCSSQ